MFDPSQLYILFLRGEGGNKIRRRTSAFLLSSVLIASSAPNPFLFLLAPNIAQTALFIALSIFCKPKLILGFCLLTLFLQKQCQFVFVLGWDGE